VSYSDAQLHAVMEILGVSAVELRTARRNGRHLEELQRRVKRNYRLAALELHPDRTDGDVECTELFKLMSEVVKEIQELQPAVPAKWAWRMSIEQRG